MFLIFSNFIDSSFKLSENIKEPPSLILSSNSLKNSSLIGKLDLSIGSIHERYLLYTISFPP